MNKTGTSNNTQMKPCGLPLALSTTGSRKKEATPAGRGSSLLVIGLFLHWRQDVLKLLIRIFPAISRDWPTHTGPYIQLVFTKLLPHAPWPAFIRSAQTLSIELTLEHESLSRLPAKVRGGICIDWNNYVANKEIKKSGIHERTLVATDQMKCGIVMCGKWLKHYRAHIVCCPLTYTCPFYSGSSIQLCVDYPLIILANPLIDWHRPCRCWSIQVHHWFCHFYPRKPEQCASL